MENISGTGKKYAGIDLAGRKSLNLESGIQEFPGFPEGLKSRFSLLLRFTSGSEQEVKDRISGPIQDIGRQLGIGFIIAGRDYPLHSTLLEGLYEGQDAVVRDKLFESLSKNPEIAKITNGLLGERLIYKYLLLDKGNLLLAAIDIPAHLINFREELAELYRGSGLKPLPLDNLLHISLARMVQLPEENRQSKFNIYRKQLTQLRHDISSNPLSLEVVSLSASSAFDLLHELKKD